jgi:predicted transcriptional regulator
MAQVGSKNHNARLSESQVRQIKELLRQREENTHEKIAERFGISECVIGKIKKGTLWKHVR